MSSVDVDGPRPAGWCWCGLEWLPEYVLSQTEEAMRHTRDACLQNGPQAQQPGEGEGE